MPSWIGRKHDGLFQAPVCRELDQATGHLRTDTRPAASHYYGAARFSDEQMAALHVAVVGVKGLATMDDRDRDESGDRADPDLMAKAAALAEQTGITEPQAWDLIRLVGRDWASLLREARILARRTYR